MNCINNKSRRTKRAEGRPIWTATKQSISYITIEGIRSDTSWQEHDWPREIMKELISNAYDFFREAYPDGTKEIGKIAVRGRLNIGREPNKNCNPYHST